MKIEIKLRIAATDDGFCEEEILSLDKPHDRLEAIGLSLAEAKGVLGRLQEHIIAAQAATLAAERRCCAQCGRAQPSKGRAVIRFRTPFGDVPISSPRLHRCACDAGKSKTFSPLTEFFSEHVAPELLYLETKWASLVSFGVTVDLLKDVLPVGSTLNAETVRNHLHRTAARAEAELGEERPSFVEGFPPMWAKLPIPEGPIVVGIDGGYVRARDGTQSHFEVMVGKSIPEDRDNRYFGLVQSHDDKPRRRLHEVLLEQGLQMNQDITFLTDGGDSVRNMAVAMSPCAEHVLDWFHITMRLTVLGQYAKGLAHHNPREAEDAARELKRIKGYLWNGNHRRALPCIEWLVDDLDVVETDYPSMKAFRKAADEFNTYIANNAGMIPNYAERRRYGERVSTGFVESTVNVVVGKRFSKRQQMRWSKEGAHLLLQTRTRVLDGTLRGKFEQWYPGLSGNKSASQLETAMAA
ncbi:ISKra4 family transposase [Mesorhizobium denitrificans]|uniref:ISKra4 family transposase n=1 Tax=Mesorhizobium denitrificans TaxID=2294114 RepID=A0A371X6F1_9HYPH|nr:ISKra4 family transposase [Mesorhizobium denitrificans]RFC64809.1 ISKra4 family transposase [Mesorhizobium denitrificans]